METLIVDQATWGKIRVTGADRVRFIHGMCTANIETLAEGDWLRCAMLNIKGRVTAVFETVNRGEDLLLLCEPGLAEKVESLLSKHAIMDDVAFEHIEVPLHRVWSDADSVWTAPPVFEPAAGAASSEQVDARRVEAGMPRYGVDVSEDNFPFESLLGRHVDYEKGCYIGQEPVYRVFSKGSPAKMLRGLVLEGEGPIEVGAAIDHADRPGAGTVTSAVSSPIHGSIALGYVHRKVNEPGTMVTVAGRSARIVELPFGA